MPVVRMPPFRRLFLTKPEADRLLPLLWGNEREYGHCSQPCKEAPWDSIPLWRLLWQDLQEATVLVQPHVVLPTNSHPPKGEGFSEEWRQEPMRLTFSLLTRTLLCLFRTVCSLNHGDFPISCSTET